jgi:hypothetical protein
MKRTLQLATILLAAMSAAAQSTGHNPQAPQPQSDQPAISDAGRQSQTQPHLVRAAASVPSFVNVSLPAALPARPPALNDASVYDQHVAERNTETYQTENDLGYPSRAKLGTAIQNARARHFVRAFCKTNGNGATWSYPLQDRLISGTCGN